MFFLPISPNAALERSPVEGFLHQKTIVGGLQNNCNMAISTLREKNLLPIHTLFENHSAITRKWKSGPQHIVEAVASYSTSVCYVCHIFRN